MRVTVGSSAKKIEKNGDHQEVHLLKIKIQVEYNGGGYSNTGTNSTFEINGSTQTLQRVLNFTHLIVRSVACRHSRDANKPRGQSDDTVSITLYLVQLHRKIDDFSLSKQRPSLLKADAQQFPQIPIANIESVESKMRVPHNATVDITALVVTYSGTFNGTFKAAREWTNDPAWLLFDLL